MNDLLGTMVFPVMKNLLQTMVLLIIIVLLENPGVAHDHHRDSNATEKDILLRMEQNMNEHLLDFKEHQKILIKEIVSMNQNMSTFFETFGLKNRASKTQ
jgi:hypothetical protein